MFDADESLLSFPITAKDTQMFSSVFGIGAALGALPAGYVSRMFGRPASMMLFEGFLLVGWVMLVLPTSVWMLSAGRMMQGIGVGALCAVIPSYIGEIAEPRMRGALHYIFKNPIFDSTLVFKTFIPIMDKNWLPGQNYLSSVRITLFPKFQMFLYIKKIGTHILMEIFL